MKILRDEPELRRVPGSKVPSRTSPPDDQQEAGKHHSGDLRIVESHASRHPVFGVKL
jgi:hypothetical protein